MKNQQNNILSIRLPAYLKNEIGKKAKLNTRTYAGQIVFYIKKGLESDGVDLHELEKLGSRD
jgi:hypothetical protein